MSKRFRDFDAWCAEQQREPVRVKLFGEVHELPPALPAAVMLRVLRLQEEGGGVVPDAEVLKMAEAIFGKERLDAWCAKGLDAEQLGAMLQWVIGVYRGVGDDEGNRSAPTPGAAASSKTGN